MSQYTTVYYSVLQYTVLVLFSRRMHKSSSSICCQRLRKTSGLPQLLSTLLTALSLRCVLTSERLKMTPSSCRLIPPSSLLSNSVSSLPLLSSSSSSPPLPPHHTHTGRGAYTVRSVGEGEVLKARRQTPGTSRSHGNSHQQK